MIKYFINIPLFIWFSFSCAHLFDQNWYMGNTHAHTKICGHYNFLILSEHNHFIDPDTVQLPPDK